MRSSSGTTASISPTENDTRVTATLPSRTISTDGKSRKERIESPTMMAAPISPNAVISPISSAPSTVVPVDGTS